MDALAAGIVIGVLRVGGYLTKNDLVGLLGDRKVGSLGSLLGKDGLNLRREGTRYVVPLELPTVRDDHILTEARYLFD